MDMIKALHNDGAGRPVFGSQTSLSRPSTNGLWNNDGGNERTNSVSMSAYTPPTPRSFSSRIKSEWSAYRQGLRPRSLYRNLCTTGCKGTFTSVNCGLIRSQYGP